MLSTLDYFKYIIHFIEVFNLTLVFAALSNWKNLAQNYKWVAIQVLLIVPFLSINYLFGLYFQINNRFVAHLIIHSDFILINLFFYWTITNVFWKKALKIFAALFILFTILNYTFFESFIFDTPDNLSILLSSWFVILSLVVYYEIYSEGRILDLGKSPLFWITTALFLNNITAIFIDATGNFWSYDWHLAIIINFVKSIIWFISVLMMLKFFRCIKLNSKN